MCTEKFRWKNIKSHVVEVRRTIMSWLSIGPPTICSAASRTISKLPKIALTFGRGSFSFWLNHSGHLVIVKIFPVCLSSVNQGKCQKSDYCVKFKWMAYRLVESINSHNQLFKYEILTLDMHSDLIGTILIGRGQQMSVSNSAGFYHTQNVNTHIFAICRFRWFCNCNCNWTSCWCDLFGFSPQKTAKYAHHR